MKMGEVRLIRIILPNHTPNHTPKKNDYNYDYSFWDCLGFCWLH